MHAIQTSGNDIRNITADPHAGANAEEVDDPRIWVEAIRQWSTFHPEFSFLPRKFKIAVTASPADRAATKVYDIGLRLHRNDAGELGFEVLVGGGLGRTPYLGPTIREHLPARAPAVVPAGDPAGLQPLRPARQHLEGAHQGAGRQPGRRGLRPRGRGGVGRRPTRPRSTCRTRSWPASAPPSRRATSRRLPATSAAFEAARGRPGVRPLRPQQRQAAQDPRLRHRRRVAEEARRDARRLLGRADGRDGRPRPSATRWTRSGSPTSRT